MNASALPPIGAGVAEHDLRLSDGRMLHVYDRAPAPAAPTGTPTGTPAVEPPAGTVAVPPAETAPEPVAVAEPLVVFWQHGTPNLGAPPEPLFAAADRLGIRWVSFDRPGYGRSTPDPGRTPASVARDLAEVADAFGVERFAVIGHSGGAVHAMAAGSVLGDRVLAVAAIAGLAPYGPSDLDWFADMIPSGRASLGAASRGREARRLHEESGAVYDPEFTEADLAILDGEWRWLPSVVEPALDAGIDGLIDDDVAYVGDWGCDPVRIGAPVLLLTGEQDRIVPASHGRWLARHCPTARLRTYGDDGHLSVLAYADDALLWLAERARTRP